MRDNDHSCRVVVDELLSQFRLDEVVGLEVNVGGRLVQDKNLRSQKHGSCQANELLLAN